MKYCQEFVVKNGEYITLYYNMYLLVKESPAIVNYRRKKEQKGEESLGSGLITIPHQQDTNLSLD